MGIRNARIAGGIAPKNPSDNPTPQPINTAMLSMRSENAPIVNRTAAPLTNTNAKSAASRLAAARSAVRRDCLLLRKKRVSIEVVELQRFGGQFRIIKTPEHPLFT
mgnify:CR=1 FL=1